MSDKSVVVNLESKFKNDLATVSQSRYASPMLEHLKSYLKHIF